MTAPSTAIPISNSARPETTAAIMAQTGLDEALLRHVVVRFYDQVRADALLGPIFAERISDWGPHLDRMTAFWSSVALKTGRYHGRPVPAHLPLPIDAQHFERWLVMFRQTATDLCSPEGAACLIDAAERIARSLNMAIDIARSVPGAPPVLR